MLKLKLFSVWRYKGDFTRPKDEDLGRGELHTVVYHEPGEVVTYSKNHGFLGPLPMFTRCFEFVSDPMIFPH